MIPDADEKIILATIEEGSNNPTNRFSTVKIAQNCGVSEFVIYDHFKTKIALLNATDLYLSNLLFAYAEEACKANDDFFGFFNDLMMFQVCHPSWNGFWLNYSSVFPRFALEKEESPAQVPVSLLREFEKYFLGSNYQDLDEAFRFIVRETICFARYVIYSEVPGNAHRIEAESKIVYGGLNAFKLVKEAKGQPGEVPTHVKND
jgi:AcrR family transcriptional regulator